MIAGITSKSPLPRSGLFAFVPFWWCMPDARPILSLSVHPIDPADRPHLHAALDALASADPVLRFSVDSATGATVLAGSSELHLRQICHRLERECLIPLDATEPQVVYLQTIQSAAESEGKYIRQTGGCGNYGHVKLRLRPNTPGAGLEFASSIAGSVVPPEFFIPIEEGIREAARAGILAGKEMTDVRVTLFDGSYHEVDSNPMAFRIAASMAFQDAARKAHPIVLEPVMAVVFTIAEPTLDGVLREVSARRGRVVSTSTVRGMAIVGASIPLAELLGGLDPAARVVGFEGFEPVSSGWDDADPAGSIVRNPRGPEPRFGSAAAERDPDLDPI